MSLQAQFRKLVAIRNKIKKLETEIARERKRARGRR